MCLDMGGEKFFFFFFNKSKWNYITKPTMITPHMVCKKESTKKKLQNQDVNYKALQN